MAAVAAGLVTSVWLGQGSPALSSGETRTISLYHVHTGESLTVTYMVDGRYVPSAMKKINYLLRDWRRNQVITIDPKTIDLVWELHADLGSQAPIHIVCGYRSAATNNFLHSIGRNVALQSQHILGKAIDIYFPDVPTIKMRNSALVRQVGGVGYYRSAGGPSGFLHVDSGRVRHWGPGIGAFEMARIFQDYRRTIGARLNPHDQVMMADSNGNSPSQQDRLAAAKQVSLEATSEGDDEELANLSQKAAEAPGAARTAVPVPQQKPAAEQTAAADPIPKPRPKPIEVLMMAAVNMKIEPASAPPPTAVEQHSPASDSIGVVAAAETMAEPSTTDTGGSTANEDGKGSLAATLADGGTSSGVPVIKTITASAAGSDLYWWPQQLIFNSDKAVRRDGAPQPFADATAGILPGDAAAAEAPAPRLVVASMALPALGKGDFQGVNRKGKGNLAIVLPDANLKVGQIDPQ